MHIFISDLYEDRPALRQQVPRPGQPVPQIAEQLANRFRFRDRSGKLRRLGAILRSSSCSERMPSGRLAMPFTTCRWRPNCWAKRTLGGMGTRERRIAPLSASCEAFLTTCTPKTNWASRDRTRIKCTSFEKACPWLNASRAWHLRWIGMVRTPSTPGQVRIRR